MIPLYWSLFRIKAHCATSLVKCNRCTDTHGSRGRITAPDTISDDKSHDDCSSRPSSNVSRLPHYRNINEIIVSHFLLDFVALKYGFCFLVCCYEEVRISFLKLNTLLLCTYLGFWTELLVNSLSRILPNQLMYCIQIPVIDG